MPDLLQAVKKQFAKDLYATQTTGIDIEDVGEQYAKCVLHLDEKHRNAMGAVMGGVLYTLADFAFAVAANHCVIDTVSVSGNISFCNSTKGTILYAEAQCVKNGRNNCFYTVNISDEYGVLVAIVSIVGANIKQQTTN